MKHQNQEKAIDAVFRARPEVLENMINDGTFDTCLLQDIGCYSAPFPIYMITKCYEELIRPDEWIEDFKRNVYDAVERNNRIKAIWKETFGIDIDTIELEIASYVDDFISGDDDVSYLEELAGSVYELSQELPADKIELLIACYTFDFEETERLLKEGGDVMWLYNFGFDDEGFLYGLNVVWMSCDFVNDVEAVPIEGAYIIADEPTVDRMVEAVANLRMCNLLEKYGGRLIDDDEDEWDEVDDCK